MKVSVVIPAAGQGKRMKIGKNKQFLLLDNKPILAHTIAQFEIDEIDSIILVVKEGEEDYCKRLIEEYNFKKINKLVLGGESRQESVYNGLQEVEEDIDFVLVHDGARPLLTKSSIRNIITEVKEYKAVALGVKVKDTIKVVNQDGQIISTLNRDDLVAIQTPQAFEKDLILKAYRKAKANGIIGTDSASLLERLGSEVKVMSGSYENLKITTPEDLDFAAKILARRK